MRWKVHGRRTMYESDWVNVYLDDVELPDGTHIDHHVLTFPKGSQTAVVVNPAETHILLIWRHRFVTDQWGWEVPAGWVEPSEDPLEAIQREVLEETGYRVKNLDPLIAYDAMPGISTMRFVAWKGEADERLQRSDIENEVFSAHWIPAEQVRDYLLRGEISDGPSVAALSTYLTASRHSNEGESRVVPSPTANTGANMSLTNTVGFWSYTHRDNDLDGGRIIRLAERLRDEYELLTGDELQIFIDKKDLSWGDEWKARIDDALIGTTFFIPIVTPKFFRSSECRRELILFADQAESLGVKELLLPLLYLDVPALHDESTEDEAVSKIKQTQYVNWTELRLEDEDSARYRREVNKLAKRLAEIASLVSQRPTVLLEESKSVEAEEEFPPGFYESMAEAEALLPEWQTIIVRIGELSREIGEAMEKATAEVAVSDKRNGGFAGRLRVAKNLAATLSPVANEMESLSAQYSSTLVRVDPGVLTIIRLVGEAVDDQSEASEVEQARDLFESITGFATISRDNVETIGTFIGTLASIGNFDRGLGQQMRKIKSALQKIIDGQAVMDEWQQRIDATNISTVPQTDS